MNAAVIVRDIGVTLAGEELLATVAVRMSREEWGMEYECEVLSVRIDAPQSHAAPELVEAICQ